MRTHRVGPDGCHRGGIERAIGRSHRALSSNERSAATSASASLEGAVDERRRVRQRGDRPHVPRGMLREQRRRRDVHAGEIDQHIGIVCGDRLAPPLRPVRAGPAARRLAATATAASRRWRPSSRRRRAQARSIASSAAESTHLPHGEHDDTRALPRGAPRPPTGTLGHRRRARRRRARRDFERGVAIEARDRNGDPAQRVEFGRTDGARANRRQERRSRRCVLRVRLDWCSSASASSSSGAAASNSVERATLPISRAALG